MQTDKDLIDDYLNGESVNRLARKNKTTDPKIKQRLLDLGYKYLHADQRSPGRNYSAFSDVKEEACAYFYGFILGDGCLSSRNNVILTLKEQDKSILIKLKEYLGHPNSVTTSKRLKNKNTGEKGEYATFSFSDTLAINRLKSFGLSMTKSGNEKVPACFKYDRHFWRGLVDADGSLSIRNYSTSSKTASLSLVSSEECVLDFKNFCESITDCNVRISDHTVSNKIKYATVTGQEARKIAMYLYRDCSLFLDRKHSLARELYLNFWELLQKDSIQKPMKHPNGTWFMQISVGKKTIREYGFTSESEAIVARDSFVDKYNKKMKEENIEWLTW